MAFVLITGGAGFIGTHTANALIQAGESVRILDCLDPQIHGTHSTFPDNLHPDVERIQGDIRNAADVKRALKNVNAIYHFAALTGVGQSMYDQSHYIDVNCRGTAVLLEQIARNKSPLKRFVLASSRAVYGEGAGQCPTHGTVFPEIRTFHDLSHGRFECFCPTCQSPITAIATPEDQPGNPTSLYGYSKKHQEDLCRCASKTYDIPLTILRYFNVYGSGQSLRNPYTGIMSIFYSRLKAGQPISLYEGGTPLRDFVNICDVVQANIKALHADLPSGSCVNVGHGDWISVCDTANALGRAMNITPRFLDHGEFRVGDIRSCVADLTNARHLLNYTPKITLKQGLREFVRWADDQPWSDDYEKSHAELTRQGLMGRGITPRKAS